MMGTAIPLLLSIGLSIVFLASAVPKLRHPKGFILAVLEYRILPARLSWGYGRVLPPLELLLALLLLSGTAVRLAALVGSLLLLSFLLAVGINVARGRTLDCQCFGKARQRPIGWGLLLQDAALLGAACTRHQHAVVARPGTLVALCLVGLAAVGSPVLLLSCAIVTAGAAVLLSRSSFRKKHSGKEMKGGVK